MWQIPDAETARENGKIAYCTLPIELHTTASSSSDQPPTRELRPNRERRMPPFPAPPTPSQEPTTTSYIAFYVLVRRSELRHASAPQGQAPVRVAVPAAAAELIQPLPRREHGRRTTIDVPPGFPVPRAPAAAGPRGQDVLPSGWQKSMAEGRVQILRAMPKEAAAPVLPAHRKVTKASNHEI